MTKSVFISHSHKDHVAADAVCVLLETAGVKCWISSRDIPPGATWADEIMTGLDECRFVVLVLSKRSQASKDVMRELNAASTRGMPIITFRIDDTPVQGPFEYYTSAQQWVDAHSPVKREDLQKLLDAVERQLAKKEQVWAYGSEGKGRPRSRRAVILAALAFVAVVTGAVFRDSIFPPSGAGNPDPISQPETTLVARDSTMIDAGGETEDVGQIFRNEPPADGFVSFLSNPAGAALTVNGESYGETPRRNVSMSPGAYSVVFVLEGFESKSRSIVVSPGATLPVEVDLARLTSKLSVSSIPEAARVQIGRLSDTTPCEFSGLSGGRHVVRISLDGYTTRTDTLTLVAGQDARHSVRLTEAKGWLEVSIVPKGMVFLDGERKTGDTSRPYPMSLPPGTYEVEARHVTHGAWPKTVTVVDGQEERLVFDFTVQYDVLVTSVPGNAAIYVDGQDTGKVTPFTIKLRPGLRRIEVVRDHYRGGSPIELLIESSEIPPVRFELTRVP